MALVVREWSEVRSATSSGDQTGGREDSTEGMIGAGSSWPGVVWTVWGNRVTLEIIIMAGITSHLKKLPLQRPPPAVGGVENVLEVIDVSVVGTL